MSVITWPKGIWTISKKELGEYFTSPLIYILSALYIFLMGWLFFNYLVNAKQLTTMTMTQTVLRPIFGNMNFILIFLVPLFTMRLIAEERKFGTLNLLLISELSSSQIILGKIIAAFTSICFMLSFTLIFPVILAMSGYSDWGVVSTNYLGILGQVICYLAVGLFASSITENQIVAALLGFCILLGIMLLALTAQAIHNPLLGDLISYFSLALHFEPFTRGSIRSYDIFYFFSFFSFFFFLTVQSLESRRW